MNTTAVARQEDSWRNELRRMDGEFAAALPEHIQAERFRRAAETAVMINPDLASCDRRSLFQALMRCAETGLMPDGKHAALVPYKGKVQFLPMVFGLLSLMRNSDEIMDITVDVIREGDEYEIERGDNPRLYHKPNLSTDGPILAAYAILKTKDGGRYAEIMGRKALDKVRNCSQSWRYAESGPAHKGGGKKDSVWHVWEDEMSIKSAIKRLSKRSPTSNDRLTRAVNYDNLDYVPSLANVPVQPQLTKSQAIAATLRGEDHDDNDATPPERPADEPADVTEVEAETVETETQEPAAEPEAASNVNPESAFINEDDAIRDIERHIADAADGPDMKERYAGWKELVEVSFVDASAVLAAGQKLAQAKLTAFKKGAKQ